MNRIQRLVQDRPKVNKIMILLAIATLVSLIINFMFYEELGVFFYIAIGTIFLIGFFIYQINKYKKPTNDMIAFENHYDSFSKLYVNLTGKPNFDDLMIKSIDGRKPIVGKDNYGIFIYILDKENIKANIEEYEEKIEYVDEVTEKEISEAFNDEIDEIDDEEIDGISELEEFNEDIKEEENVEEDIDEIDDEEIDGINELEEFNEDIKEEENIEDDEDVDELEEFDDFVEIDTLDLEEEESIIEIIKDFLKKVYDKMEEIYYKILDKVNEEKAKKKQNEIAKLEAIERNIRKQNDNYTRIRIDKRKLERKLKRKFETDKETINLIYEFSKPNSRYALRYFDDVDKFTINNFY